MTIILVTAILGSSTAVRRDRRHSTQRNPAVFAQPCRLTISAIQIGAKGDVQPFDTG
jgi:hypothetical protein